MAGKVIKMGNRYCIIDVEIQNVMSKEKWDNKMAIPMLCGVLLCEDDKIQAIIQIPKMRDISEENFRDNIRQLIGSLDNANYKLYALNSAFESECIQAYTGQLWDFHEIRGSLKGFLSSKDNLWQFLRKCLRLPEIHDVLGGNSALCPQYYGFYLQTHEYKFLQDILAHNQNCLLKEYFILKHIETINKYAIVDNNSFISGWKEIESEKVEK